MEEKLIVASAPSGEPTIEAPSGAERQWEWRTANETDRQRVNGETAAQMAWALATKSADDGATDHSVDEVWVQQCRLVDTDSFVWAAAACFLSIKLLLLWLPSFLAALPPALLAHAYGACLPRPCDSPPRTALFYLVIGLIGSLLLLPLGALALVGLLLDYLFYYFCGSFYWFFVRGALAAHFARTGDNDQSLLRRNLRERRFNTSQVRRAALRRSTRSVPSKAASARGYAGTRSTSWCALWDSRSGRAPRSTSASDLSRSRADESPALSRRPLLL